MTPSRAPKVSKKVRKPGQAAAARRAPRQVTSPPVQLSPAADEAAAVRYADVFISHQRADIRGAESLAQRIRALGHSCYLDAFDASLVGKHAGALADHVRVKLRGARALIFYFTDHATASKWMPWELGFFDGRWGKATVGIFLAADGVAPAVAARPASPAAFTVQEYLEIYERVTVESLPDFLDRAASFDTLANRSDVDVDRAMSMLTAALHNPLAFALGWQKYLLGMWRPAMKDQPGALMVLDQMIDMLARLRAQTSTETRGGQPGAADAWRAPLDGWLAAWQHALGQGAESSARAAGRGPAADPAAAAAQGAYANVIAAARQGAPGLQDLFQQMHEGGVAASVQVPLKPAAGA
jgi:hypothetical protein